MARNSSTRIRKNRIDPTMVVANEIDMPKAQRIKGDLVLVDVVNFTDADQRHMVRQAKRQTIRKLTKLEKLHNAKIITKHELLACEWYQGEYESQYEARVKIADWAATGGGSDRAYGHWPHGERLTPSPTLFQEARASLCPVARPLFERVVLHGRPLGKLAITFRMTAQRLLAHIEGKVAL